MITYDEFLESYRHRAKKYAVRFRKRKTVDRKPSYREFENMLALVLSDLLKGKYPVSNPYYPLAYEVKENGDSGFVDVNRVWVGLDVYDGLEENLHDIKNKFWVMFRESKKLIHYAIQLLQIDEAVKEEAVMGYSEILKNLSFLTNMNIKYDISKKENIIQNMRLLLRETYALEREVIRDLSLRVTSEAGSLYETNA